MTAETCPCAELFKIGDDYTREHHVDCHFKAVVFQSGGPECESTPGTPVDLHALSKLRGYTAIPQEEIDALLKDMAEIVALSTTVLLEITPLGPTITPEDGVEYTFEGIEKPL